MTIDNTAVPAPPPWAEPGTHAEWDSLTVDGGPLASWTGNMGADVWLACDDTIQGGRWVRSRSAVYSVSRPATASTRLARAGWPPNC